MNRSTIAFAAAIVCAAASFAETYYIATVTDFAGDKSFSVVTKAEAKALDQDIKQKNALFQKVVAELQKEFAKNPEAHAGEKFLGAKLKPMTVKVAPQAFQSMDVAMEKAEKMQEREDEKGTEVGGKKKKLSAAAKERAFKEAERELAIKALGEEVVKKIEEMVTAEAGGAAK